PAACTPERSTSGPAARMMAPSSPLPGDLFMEPDQTATYKEIVDLLFDNERETIHAIIREKNLHSTLAAVARGELDAARPHYIDDLTCNLIRGRAAQRLVELGDTAGLEPLIEFLRTIPGELVH